MLLATRLVVTILFTHYSSLSPSPLLPFWISSHSYVSHHSLLLILNSKIGLITEEEVLLSRNQVNNRAKMLRQPKVIRKMIVCSAAPTLVPLCSLQYLLSLFPTNFVYSYSRSYSNSIASQLICRMFMVSELLMFYPSLACCMRVWCASLQ